MPLVLNFTTPDKFKLVSYFKNRKFLGIGKYSSKVMLKLQGSSVYQKNIFQSKIPIDIEIKKLVNKLYKFKIKKDLLKKINNIVKLNNYKGHRHSIFLPVRGQRTKTNAKTRKKRHIN